MNEANNLMLNRMNIEDDDVDHERYLNSFPPGYRFYPTSKELVCYYLKNKVFIKPLPPNKMKEVNINEYSPMELSEMHDKEGSGTMYFFTPRERKVANGKNTNRVAGIGFWKASGKAKKVARFGSLIAYEGSLVYHQKITDKQSVKTDWLMKEFTLTDHSRTSSAKRRYMKLHNWVLCIVYKKKRSSRKEGDFSVQQNLLLPSGGQEDTQWEQNNNHRPDPNSSNQNFADQQIPLESMDTINVACEDPFWCSFFSLDREDSEPKDFGGVPILDNLNLE